MKSVRKQRDFNKSFGLNTVCVILFLMLPGTAANATDSTAAKSDGDGEKSTDDDDKGAACFIYRLQK